MKRMTANFRKKVISVKIMTTAAMNVVKAAAMMLGPMCVKAN